MSNIFWLILASVCWAAGEVARSYHVDDPSPQSEPSPPPAPAEPHPHDPNVPHGMYRNRFGRLVPLGVYQDRYGVNYVKNPRGFGRRELYAAWTEAKHKTPKIGNNPLTFWPASDSGGPGGKY